MFPPATKIVFQVTVFVVFLSQLSALLVPSDFVVCSQLILLLLELGLSLLSSKCFLSFYFLQALTLVLGCKFVKKVLLTHVDEHRFEVFVNLALFGTALIHDYL